MVTLNPQKISAARKEVDSLNSEARTADQLMEGMTVLLNKHMLKYSWVGFYMLEPGVNPPVLGDQRIRTQHRPPAQ